MSERLQDLLEERAAEDLGDGPADDIIEAVEEMVAHPEYPCLGARSVFRRDAATLVVLDDLSDTSDGGSLDLLAAALARYADEVDVEGDLVSFVACFREPVPNDEREFENLLWGALQHLHDQDDEPWADGVAADPDSPHFAFSLSGTAFFVVGLHPNSSRVARRTPLPTLVFNLHEQFERLRADGRFERMRDTIRRRDTDLQGSLNPMVSDHGKESEARQYAGRAVPDRWSAPFHATDATDTPHADGPADAAGPAEASATTATTDTADATETPQ
ncbi:guanitoxin biosynthesis heme-dependent pre-guanitoxin N-hydroxylase GntA [Ornithinibacter sp.]|uniref:guanitoxin biosynthesis heme-dependent pre-guanitoxin N-hydroxylase GntA n=1 Tax=Ornithinibacter sp. TaxID=2862748 RepID=UPI002BEA54D0|nr:guanitoxin biosynthesis heme-dependent pre-guanitoxin N-hydroxylase GntA [Ornithinibacter sp.]MBU9945199.1 YqcI/YcgG family protein [Dermatophilaceae bacterium]HRA27710.1 guanitoxin biosynthesis heme-dependent pre-guanitoxin N-hydroxylase GntA [Ornithinibacter sp.]